MSSSRGQSPRPERRAPFLPRRKPGRAELGQDAVEFALVLPLLLIVFLAVADFGRVMFTAIAITNAAREGARYGSRFPADWDGVEAAVVAEADGSGIDLSTDDTEIAISCPDAPLATLCPRGTPMRVEVTHAFQLMTTMLFADVEVPVASYAEMMVP